MDCSVYSNISTDQVPNKSILTTLLAHSILLHNYGISGSIYNPVCCTQF